MEPWPWVSPEPSFIKNLLPGALFGILILPRSAPVRLPMPLQGEKGLSTLGPLVQSQATQTQALLKVIKAQNQPTQPTYPRIEIGKGIATAVAPFFALLGVPMPLEGWSFY
jgi:hypothetical protein